MGCSSSDILTEKNIYHPNHPYSYLWSEYTTMFKESKKAKQKNQDIQTVQYNDKVMEFDFTIKGQKPIEGYPLYLCLHDGEVSHTAYNTSEYKKMKTYYLKSITVGICLAVRGISDQSNLHYMDESFILYEKLIREMIAVHQANPNKVYLIGIGLGGDAVYQIATRIPERFAAVCINSGHSYGLNMKNLLGLPVQIQVGENDYMFEKNKNAVNVYNSLLEMYKSYNIPPPTIECNLHADKDKHIIDYNLKKIIQPVISDPKAWLNSQEYTVVEKNTNAILFLSQFERNPFPKKIVWDLTKLVKTDLEYDKRKKDGDKNNEEKSPMTNLKNGTAGQKTDGGATLSNFKLELMGGANKNDYFELDNILQITNHFYWLEVGNKKIDEIGAVEIIARFERSTNSVIIETPIKFIRVLLCDEMMDLKKEINFDVHGFTKSIKVNRNFTTERRSINERGDYYYIFSVCVVIESKDCINYTIEQLVETTV